MTQSKTSTNQITNQRWLRNRWRIHSFRGTLKQYVVSVNVLYEKYIKLLTICKHGLTLELTCYNCNTIHIYNHFQQC